MSEIDRDIALTILHQLGGKQFCFMTQARPAIIEGGLSMILPDDFAKSGINLVEVRLNRSDLYNAVFKRVAGSASHVVATFEDVYAEDLPMRFRDATALATRLPRIRVIAARGPTL